MAVRSGICALTPSPSLAAAARRVAVEIEFAAVDVRHLGETLAEGIEADDVRVHFA